jgi:hypothetical protein
MRGPRKVRIFRDTNKSPNWYVEWRDLQGRRHCESCGPHRRDARERASQIAAELQGVRSGAPVTGSGTVSGVIAGAGVLRSQGENSAYPLVHVHAVLRCPNVELPVDLLIEVNPDVLKAIGQFAAQLTEE